VDNDTARSVYLVGLCLSGVLVAIKADSLYQLVRSRCYLPEHKLSLLFTVMLVVSVFSWPLTLLVIYIFVLIRFLQYVFPR